MTEDGLNKATLDGWVARDEDGELYMFNNKPIKGEHWWKLNIDPNSNSESYKLDSKSLETVKWEDTEPTPCKIEIKII